MLVNNALPSEETQRLESKSRKSLRWSILSYLIALSVSISGACLVHRVSIANLRSPWRIRDSDLSSAYAMAAALKQSWFGIVDHHLGAPYSADYNLAYAPEDVHANLTRVLVHIFRQPIFTVNFIYILSFGLTAVSALWLARKIGIKNPIAVAVSLAFSWLPYHFIRMDYGHVVLAEYFMIPIGLWIVISEYVRFDEPFRERHVWNHGLLHALALSLLVGASNSYYALFFSILTFSLVPVAILTRKGTAHRLSSVFRLTCLSVALMLPTLLHDAWANLHRTSPQILDRSPEESIRFGGSIARLLIPWGVHVPQSLSRLIPWEEFEWTATPIMVSIGVLLVLMSVLFAIVRQDNKVEPICVPGYLRYLGSVALLFYTSSGFGLIFAGTVSPIFRCWNRLSVVLSLIGLLALGKQLSTGKIERFANIIGPVLICVAMGTQILNASELRVGPEPDPDSRLLISELITIRSEIEKQFNEGCRFLQLPIVEAFGGSNVNALTPGNQYWLPLYLPNMYWSFGAASGTPAGDFWKTKSNQGIDALYHAATENRFCGVVLDRRGYPTDEEFQKEIRLWEERSTTPPIYPTDTLALIRLSRSES